MNDPELNDPQYHRAPRNSTDQSRDRRSSVRSSASQCHSQTNTRSATTHFMDASIILSNDASPYSTNGAFPRGKGRRPASVSRAKKSITDSGSMLVVPCEKIALDTVAGRLERSRSILSMSDPPRKTADMPNTRLFSAMVIGNANSTAKVYGQCATAHNHAAWVQRYKFMNKSQLLIDFLRDPTCYDETLRETRSYQQLFRLSSLCSLPTRTPSSKRRDKAEPESSVSQSRIE